MPGKYLFPFYSDLSAIDHVGDEGTNGATYSIALRVFKTLILGYESEDLKGLLPYLTREDSDSP